jgi:PAS domain-containing protein
MIVPHELIQALIVTASDAIMAADRTGVINFWNLGTDRIFGFRLMKPSDVPSISSFLIISARRIGPASTV